LCYWLKGEDDVKKGQIAHLDGNHANSSDDNLAFLCLEHHDEFDSTPSVSKGLREREVRQWRDELYKEMEYRFRTSRRHVAELKIIRFVRLYASEEYSNYCAHFRLRNTGEAEIRSPTVSIDLTDQLFGEPKWDVQIELKLPSTKQLSSDLFRANGRIASIAPSPVLLKDHSVDFFGLSLFYGSKLDGAAQTLSYRVDGEAMSPLLGELELMRPSDPSSLVTVGYLVAEELAKANRWPLI
jgi:hypothetical protein